MSKRLRTAIERRYFKRHLAARAAWNEYEAVDVRQSATFAAWFPHLKRHSWNKRRAEALMRCVTGEEPWGWGYSSDQAIELGCEGVPALEGRAA